MKQKILILLTLTTHLMYADVSSNVHTHSDGYIVSEAPWAPVPADYADVLFSRICTISDGLKVYALLGKPKHITKHKYPVIIYNRGGNREFGKIEEPPQLLHELIKSGFIVLASQYRGNDGSEGKEQFGGDDVHDVLNLIKTAHNLPYADTSNIFMVGRSRGDMMTYLALKEQPPIKAAVVIAGETDLFAGAKERPDFEAKVSSELIPNFAQNRQQEYEKRSVVFWPEKINVPLLIIHGKNDWRVDINQVYTLVKKLKNLHKNFLFWQHEHGHGFPDELGHDTPNEMIPDIIAWIGSFIQYEF